VRGSHNLYLRVTPLSQPVVIILRSFPALGPPPDAQGLKKRGSICRNKVLNITERPPSIMNTPRNIIEPQRNTMRQGTMKKQAIKRR
jgi:hypothetical protein